MKQNVIVTTTSSIEAAEIVRYIDLVTSNVVIGTNFFSDLGASLTDFFGGISETYQGKLQKLYSVAISEIKDNAIKIGANAVLGLKVDFDEISGKGKSMFMISAIGTAVVLDYSKDVVPVIENSESIYVSGDKLFKEIIKKDIIDKVKNSKRLLISKEYWDYLLNNPIDDITDELLNTYLSVSNEESIKSQNESMFLNNFLIYLGNVGMHVAQDVLYKRIVDYPTTIVGFLKQMNLFNPVKILELLGRGMINEAISCLQVNKEYFTQEDCTVMEQILLSLINLPDTGKIELGKTFIGKPKEIFICPNGHSNNIDQVYCEIPICGKNIKGLTQAQVYQIEQFRKKVETLKSLLSES